MLYAGSVSFKSNWPTARSKDSEALSGSDSSSGCGRLAKKVILLMGVTIEVEDPRCTSLVEGLVLEVDDARCGHVPVKMEDPRCQSLYMR